MTSETWRRCRRAMVLVAGVCMCGVHANAQLRGGGGSETSRRVSPAVIASWSTYDNYANGKSVSLLVLWRGSPEWMLRPGGNGSGGGGSGSRGTLTLASGGVTLSMDIDVDRNVVTLLGQEVSLEKANVVLVDDADSDRGSRIVGTMWVDPEVATTAVAPPDVIPALIRSKPELFEYLRCDLQPADPMLQRIAQMLCDQMRR